MGKPAPVTKKILKAASACFNDKGVNKTTWADLSIATGSPISDLKSNFPNKHMLLIAVHGYELEELKKVYLKDVPDASLEEMVAFVVKARLKFVEKNFERTALFFRNALAGKEPWGEKLTKMVWQLSIEFASFFEKAIREGAIPKSTDTNIAVRALTSFYMTGIVTGLRDKEFSADGVWNFIEPQIHMFMEGLKK